MSSQEMPSVDLVPISRPMLDISVRASRMRKVVEPIVIVKPRNARRVWKPLRLRFLTANPSGPINALQPSLVKMIDDVCYFENSLVMSRDDHGLASSTQSS